MVGYLDLEYVLNIFFRSLKKELSPEKTEFTFQFLNDKIDQNTNFAKLPSAKWLLYSTTVNFSIQKLKINT